MAYSDGRKVALVTGAGVRLGRAVAQALAERGFRMLLHYRGSRTEAQALARSIQAAGGEARLLRADFAKKGAAEKLARAALAEFGQVDLLVNSAAVFWPTTLENLNERELETFLAINLKAPAILSAELGRGMQARGSGCIINVACISALRAWREYIPYSISKAGLWSLTQGLAKALGPEVRVNAVAPGTVLPPVGLKQAQRAALAARLPLKKLGTPDDIVQAVLYLLDAQFVTGQMLSVDGGRSLV